MDTGRRRSVWALLFTAVFSRHCFVWLSHSRALDALIATFDASWAFCGGVFALVIPESMKTIVFDAAATDPRFNQAFV